MPENETPQELAPAQQPSEDPRVSNLRSAMQRLGNYIDPQTAAVVSLSLQKHAIASVEQQVFKGVPYVNAAGVEDNVHGLPRESDVMANFLKYEKEHPNDENLDKIRDRVLNRLKDGQTFRTLQGQETLRQYTAAAAELGSQNGRGYDFSQITADQRVTLAAMDKKAYDSLVKMERAELSSRNSLTRAAHAETTRKNLEALRVNLVDMAMTDPAQFKELTPAKLGSMMQDEADYPKGFPLASSLQTAERMLKSLHEASMKPNFQVIYKAASIAANDKFYGTFQGAQRRQAQSKVLQFLLGTAKEDADPTSLQKKAQDFLKGDWREYQIDQQPQQEVRKPPPAQAPPRAKPVFLHRRDNPKRGIWVDPRTRQPIGSEVDAP